MAQGAPLDLGADGACYSLRRAVYSGAVQLPPAGGASPRAVARAQLLLPRQEVPLKPRFRECPPQVPGLPPVLSSARGRLQSDSNPLRGSDATRLPAIAPEGRLGLSSARGSSEQPGAAGPWGGGGGGDRAAVRAHLAEVRRSLAGVVEPAPPGPAPPSRKRSRLPFMPSSPRAQPAHEESREDAPHPGAALGKTFVRFCRRYREEHREEQRCRAPAWREPVGGRADQRAQGDDAELLRGRLRLRLLIRTRGLRAAAQEVRGRHLEVAGDAGSDPEEIEDVVSTVQDNLRQLTNRRRELADARRALEGVLSTSPRRWRRTNRSPRECRRSPSAHESSGGSLR